MLPVLQIRAAQAARVQYLAINEIGPNTWQIGNQQAVGDRDSSTLLATVALGGDYVRVRTEARLVGPGRQHQAGGALLRRRHADARLPHDPGPRRTAHVAATCCSRAPCRTTRRSVYTGLIKIREHAKGTTAYQTNRNLTLCEGAWAESVPNLDIETNDVKCSHASTVGPIDEEQRFYLESRGIRPEVAERLVVLGFFDEVIDQLPAGDIADELRVRVSNKLDLGAAVARGRCRHDRTSCAASTSWPTARRRVRGRRCRRCRGAHRRRRVRDRRRVQPRQRVALRAARCGATSARSSARSTAARSASSPASRARCRPRSRCRCSTHAVVDGEIVVELSATERRSVRHEHARDPRPARRVGGKEILQGIDLIGRSGEVHAVMGPNGAGKSTLSAVVMGKPGYEVLGGTVTLDGVDVLALPTWERAVAGLHLVMQYPTEVPGVMLDDVLTEALASRGRSTDGLDALLRAEAGADRVRGAVPAPAAQRRPVGRREEAQRDAAARRAAPKIAILDELDSGLDIDALRDCARRVEAMSNEPNGDAEPLGVLAITHYNRLLTELKPDHVHILVKGRIVATGGPELADALETDGYAAFASGRRPGRRRSEQPRRPLRASNVRRMEATR